MVKKILISLLLLCFSSAFATEFLPEGTKKITRDSLQLYYVDKDLDLDDYKVRKFQYDEYWYEFEYDDFSSENALGIAFPEGWLWTMMMPAALFRSARRRIVRASMGVESSVPLVSISLTITPLSRVKKIAHISSWARKV